MKRVNGLSIDFDMADGDLKVPKELAQFDTIARLDILSDWKYDLLNAIQKAHVDCFIDIMKPHSHKGLDFEQYYMVHMGVLDKLHMDKPDEAVKELCKTAFLNLQKSLGV